MQEMIVEKAQKINLKLTKSGSVAALGIDDYAEVDEGEGPAPESKPDGEEEEKQAKPVALKDNAEEDPEDDEPKKSSALVLKNDLLGSPRKVTIDSLMPIENRTLSEVPEVEEAVVEPMILTP